MEDVSGVMDRALRLIWAHLTLPELLRAAQVSQSWRRGVASELASIKSLDLSAFFVLRNAGIALGLVKRFVSATHINLGYIRLTSDVSMSVFVDAFGPQLKHLDLSSLAAKKTVNDAAIDALSQKCRGLTRLNLFGCWMITDLALKLISERCLSLQMLNVGSCTHITDAGLRFVAEGCVNLLDLNLWRLDQVSDKGLQLIAERCKLLSALVCSDAKFVTHAGLQKFAPTCKIYF